MASLLPVIEKLNAVRLTLVGDVMIDRFVYGEVDRINPEAPVPVLAVRRRVTSAGGAGNVAANLSGLGCRVTLVSVAGDDAARGTLSDLLARMPGLTARLVTDPARPTILKERFVAAGQHMLRVDDEDTAPLSPAIEDAVLDALQKALAESDGVVLSDYGKGVLTSRVIDAVMASGLPVFVDPKGRDYSRYKGARLVTPNRRELAEATGGMPTATDDEIAAAARALIGQAGIAAVLATRSAQGLSVISGTDDPVHLPTRVREVYDVSGAGDTVVATAAAAIVAGADLAAAAQLANIAAGIVVEKTGTVAVTAGELRRAVAVTYATPTIAPVLTWDEACAQADLWRAQGLRVGFTNGCFDILHQGHVTMLDRCRAACDRLVLGLNVDASIARLKGPDRPVNGQDARARVVAALGSIDAVVFFGAGEDEGDTPLQLIKAIRPDMLFKGADYTAATVVGAGFVEANGGKVVLIPLEEGFSTTATITKLANKTGSAAA